MPGRRSGSPRFPSLLAGMRLHQGHAELMNLLEQPFEPFVFGNPCPHLNDQILGDVDGAGLALLLERELMADVERAAFGAVARGIATAAADGGQAGGQQRAGRAALFEATVQLPTNQGGMLGQTQGSLRKRGESLHRKSMGKEWAKKERCEKTAGQAVRPS